MKYLFSPIMKSGKFWLAEVFTEFQVEIEYLKKNLRNPQVDISFKKKNVP